MPGHLWYTIAIVMIVTVLPAIAAITVNIHDRKHGK